MSAVHAVLPAVGGTALVGKGLCGGVADPLTRGRCGLLSPRVGKRGGGGLRRSGGDVSRESAPGEGGRREWGPSSVLGGLSGSGEEEVASKWGGEPAPEGEAISVSGARDRSPSEWGCRGSGARQWGRGRCGDVKSPCTCLGRWAAREEPGRLVLHNLGIFFRYLKAAFRFVFCKPLNLANVACSVFLPKLPLCADFPPSRV